MKFKEVSTVYLMNEYSSKFRLPHVFSETRTVFGSGGLGTMFLTNEMLLTKYWLERQSDLLVFESRQTWKGAWLL
jgi:hypothetical protein